MKQVRQIFGVTLLVTLLSLSPMYEAKAYHPGHRGSAHASLAIDTYGYYDIRVWIDGVLINRRATDYIEIYSLRAGRRIIDVEIVGPRFRRSISEVIYIHPRRWNVWAIENTGRWGWFALNPVRINGGRSYYHRGRRESVRLPAYHDGYTFKSGRQSQNQGNRPQRGNQFFLHENENNGEVRSSSGPTHSGRSNRNSEERIRNGSTQNNPPTRSRTGG